MTFELEVYGWIEQSDHNSLSGWFCLPDRLEHAKIYLEVFVGGQSFYCIQVNSTATTRTDLQDISGAMNFSAAFSSATFCAEIANANITFFLRTESTSLGIVKVVPSLVGACANFHASPKTGLSFGRLSEDNVATLGAGGNIFLVSGTNNLELLYKDESLINAARWIEVFLSRRQASHEIGCNYIQMILPEKSSVLHWKVPYAASRGSPGYMSLMKAIQNTGELGAYTFDGLDAMPDEANSESMYRAFDTHMSTAGAQLIFDQFINRFFPLENTQYSAVGIAHADLSGDLGSRFFNDGNVLERPPVYLGLESAGGEFYETSLIGCRDPSDGNTGTFRHWICPHAPIKLKVMCFGGSSFERGTDSTCLSWWFSRIFSEFLFVWSDEPDYQLIRECAPNVVVCQTVERFLTLVPDR
jgi:hypothetical protein